MRRVCRLLPVIIATLLMNISVTAAPPNVLIILTDDQGWGDLSLHGNTNLATPHIDQLAKAGAQFEHFYVCPVCSPTRAEMLTGRWHPRGGVRDVTSGGERLDLDETTIADSRGNRTTLLPARDAILSANLKRSSQHPNCSYITNWTTTDADGDLKSFNGKPQASVPVFAYACGSPLNENAAVEGDPYPSAATLPRFCQNPYRVSHATRNFHHAVGPDCL